MVSGKLLTYDQAMEKLGIESKQTFYNLIKRKAIPKTRLPGMSARVREDVLDRLIEEHTDGSLDEGVPYIG